ncbi:hypothetical protein CEXT_265031 [Caerostris extrusa]|uniref:Uncharacterized protein n=1 Tax=Caerostris extrusa TaxID=172846 RepID=A0AAV4NYI5_CAEEX|nr:hypothetical protein CEXT_265031 [Caerostris extrusa]
MRKYQPVKTWEVKRNRLKTKKKKNLTHSVCEKFAKFKNISRADTSSKGSSVPQKTELVHQKKQTFPGIRLPPLIALGQTVRVKYRAEISFADLLFTDFFFSFSFSIFLPHLSLARKSLMVPMTFSS